MTTSTTTDVLPIVVTTRRRFAPNYVAPVYSQAEYRLLGFAHRPELRRVELNLYQFDRHIRAYLSDSHLSKLTSFMNKTVRVESLPENLAYEPVLAVQRLEITETAANPLNTLLPLWLDDRQKANYGELCRLVSQLETPYRELIHEVFSDDELLKAFLNRPASLAHHHSKAGGLLEHTVEVALDCEHACIGYSGACPGLTMTSALMHDIGKCEEYLQGSSGKFIRSHIGELEMHKTLGIGIVKSAGIRCKFDSTLLSEIIHCISAANGPDYMGLPRPKMLEYVLVQSADSRSSFADQLEIRHRKPSNWANSRDKLFKSEYLRIL